MEFSGGVSGEFSHRTSFVRRGVCFGGTGAVYSCGGTGCGIDASWCRVFLFSIFLEGKGHVESSGPRGWEDFYPPEDTQQRPKFHFI
jgi:hypothetical protein